MEVQGASACGNSRSTANANDDARIRPNANRIRPGTSSASLSFGRKACIATASRPKPVTASEPLSELTRGARDVPRQLAHQPNPPVDAPPRPDREDRAEDQEPPPSALRGGDGLRDRARERRGHAGLPREVGGVVPRELGRQAERAHEEQRERDLPQEDPVREAARQETARASAIALEGLDREPHRDVLFARAVELPTGPGLELGRRAACAGDPAGVARVLPVRTGGDRRTRPYDGLGCGGTRGNLGSGGGRVRLHDSSSSSGTRRQVMARTTFGHGDGSPSEDPAVGTSPPRGDDGHPEREDDRGRGRRRHPNASARSSRCGSPRSPRRRSSSWSSRRSGSRSG